MFCGKGWAVQNTWFGWKFPIAETPFPWRRPWIKLWDLFTSYLIAALILGRPHVYKEFSIWFPKFIVQSMTMNPHNLNNRQGAHNRCEVVMKVPGPPSANAHLYSAYLKTILNDDIGHFYDHSANDRLKLCFLNHATTLRPPTRGIDLILFPQAYEPV